jgi:hypothetical protein
MQPLAERKALKLEKPKTSRVGASLLEVRGI